MTSAYEVSLGSAILRHMSGQSIHDLSGSQGRMGKNIQGTSQFKWSFVFFFNLGLNNAGNAGMLYLRTLWYPTVQRYIERQIGLCHGMIGSWGLKPLRGHCAWPPIWFMSSLPWQVVILSMVRRPSLIGTSLVLLWPWRTLSESSFSVWLET